MRTRYWILIILVLILIGGAGWGWGIYQYNNAGGPFVFNWTGPTVTEHPSNDPDTSRDIEITGKQRDKFIDVIAVDGWGNIGRRTMALDIKTIFPKWSLKIGLIGGAGYMPETKKFDALVGGEAELFRHYSRFAVGGGGWYMQGVTSDFKAGGLQASFLCSFGKQ